MNTFRRWLRYALAVFAALFVGGVAWIGWLLSGQRYQTLLTEQLSVLFGAHVQVERSHLSLHSGLGLQLELVSVRDEGSDAPLFEAENVDLLVDFAALWRGKLLFHRIDLVKPHVQVTLAGERLIQLVRRIRETQDTKTTSESWWSLAFTPTFAIQELRLQDAEVSYTKTEKSTALLFSETEASLTFMKETSPHFILRTTLKTQSEEIGRVFLRVTLNEEVDFAAWRQSKWRGEVELSDMRLQQLGEVVAEPWPSMRFGVKGDLRGVGVGPVEFDGMLHASELRVGTMQLNDIRLEIPTARWEGPRAGAWLRVLTVEAKLTHLRGEIGAGFAPLSASEGEVTLSNGDLRFNRLSGAYGKTSRFTEASVSLQDLLAKDGPKLDARIKADLDLNDDLPRLLTALTPSGVDNLSATLTQPGGRALVELRVRRARARSVPVYDGSVTFQSARARVLPWNLEVGDLNGRVQVGVNVLSSDALTFKIGESSFNAQGQMTDFLSPQRSADIRLAFHALRDYDFAQLLPSGKVVPQGGLLDGDISIVSSSFRETPRLTGQLRLTRVRLDLLDFLQPFEIVEGELHLHGQGGAFTVQRGQLPGGVFAGQGRIESWEPLRLTLSGDFPNLDLAVALALDKPDDGQPKDTTRDVQASLTSNRLVYQDTQIDNLRLFCHWHNRQADLRIEDAEVANGKVRGEVVLWPDIDAAFLRPRLENVDVERFFHAVGVSSPALSGSLDGEGRIYLPQWEQWDELASWNASLSLAVEDGVAQRLPILVRLWSVLSMQGLLRFQLPGLPTGGLPFSSLTGDFFLGGGVAATKNLSLSGDSVRIDANGRINLTQRVLELETALVPLHGITRNVAKVPLAGKLLAQSADYLTTLNFRVSGPYADPSVTPSLP